LSLNLPYKSFPLGDAALTIDFGNVIDEDINTKVISLFEHLKQDPFDGMIEAVPSYSSLTIYYDVFSLSKKNTEGKTVYDQVRSLAEEFVSKNLEEKPVSPRSIQIPVCYDGAFGTDLRRLSEEKNISIEEFVNIHCAKTYRVYMLGFLPGFPYMGIIDERIACMRKMQPEKIAAGSIGIAGRQTGIYPLTSPGGWQIIGRTPVKMFDANRNEVCFLKAGDNVTFYSIDRNEFENYQSGDS